MPYMRMFLTVVLIVLLTLGCDEKIVDNEVPGAVDRTVYTSWGMTLTDTMAAAIAADRIGSAAFAIIAFDGPTGHGDGLGIDSASGVWWWDIGTAPEYIGDFYLRLEAVAQTDPGDTTGPPVTCYIDYDIHVFGMAVTIDEVDDAIPGYPVTVSIRLDSSYMPASFAYGLIGGFDFLIGHEISILTTAAAEPGELTEDFEYFTYRTGVLGHCGRDCPTGLTRIVGLRETNDGTVNNYHVLTPGELVRMNFTVTDNIDYACEYTPITFYWIDCGDNIISDETGSWVHMGREVYDSWGRLITDPLLYGYRGPARQCYDTVYGQDEIVLNASLGSIIFRDGGVHIFCEDSVIVRGDVNFNGIAHEIADFMLFTDYYLYGDSVFEVNVAGQRAATEINGDGVYPTVADLIYLARIIIGDALPSPTIDPNALAEFHISDSTISVQTNVALGAVAISFSGTVVPQLAENADHMELKYYHDGEYTHVMTYSLDQGDEIESGDLLVLDDYCPIVSVETGEYSGTWVRAVVKSI